MRKIITIQHTQSVQHTNGMIGSWTDWDLTETGIEQANRIGKRLRAETENEQFILYASDLLRTKHTAEIIAGYFNISPVLKDVLREFNFGEAVGNSKDWARKNLLCPVWPGTIDWPISIDDRPFRCAESRKDVWNRLQGFFHDNIFGANENLIVVSHAGTLSLFFAMWLGLKIEMLEKFNFSGSAGGVSFLSEDSEKNRIINRLNDLSYICYKL